MADHIRAAYLQNSSPLTLALPGGQSSARVPEEEKNPTMCTSLSSRLGHPIAIIMILNALACFHRRTVAYARPIRFRKTSWNSTCTTLDFDLFAPEMECQIGFLDSSCDLSFRIDRSCRTNGFRACRARNFWPWSFSLRSCLRPVWQTA
jgi:hypothetical protein